MAIGYDNSTASGSASSPSTFSHTVNSNTNGVLIVGIVTPNGGGGTTDVVTSVTYNGVALTRINTTTAVNGSGYRLYLYYLLAPASGANNVVVTFTGGGTARAVATSYTGVRQTGQPDASNTATTNSNTTLTCTMTTIADNCWLVGIAEAGFNPIAGTNTTTRAFSSYIAGIDTNAAQTPAGSKSVQITESGTAEMMICAASFSPYVVSGPTNLKSYNTNAIANIKSIDTNAIANIKSLNTNT